MRLTRLIKQGTPTFNNFERWAETAYPEHWVATVAEQSNGLYTLNLISKDGSKPYKLVRNMRW